ncbi:prepilin peptidase [Erythrobacter sp. SD-21]|uniref:A24 family peptidase n=1 Tax=Erythrobacter sp. SD-21 TaxID=161528 RepID=UPI000153EFAB|nr:prepilin peptidase [Erythrobacter sp. SD-21]EDL48721.1 type IV prepilin peptidase, cpaA [Erythrobacter sp. SD-21]
MDQQIFTYVLLGALAMALLVAAFTDLKSRTIGNKLNLAIAAGAPLFWWTTGLDLWPGVGIQLGIAAATFAICTLFFAIRQMGGGDVKLLTALALWFPPTNFLGLVLVMAMLGWVLTLVMGIWGVAHSRVVGTKPLRDTALLVACTLVAANFASAVLGGPKLAIPQGLLDSLATLPNATLILAMVPMAILAVVTLASIRIIRRHEHQPRVPYGLAISMAGLWIVGGGIFSGMTAAAAG